MSLDAYRDTGFDISTKVNGFEIGVGNGVQTAFLLAELNNFTISPVIQVGSQVVYRYNGGWSITGQTLTFASPPANGAKISFAGLNEILIQLYDQDPVAGQVNPRVREVPIYIVDEDEPHIFKNVAAPGETGIRLAFVDNDVSNGAAVAWSQLAPSLPNGNPGTYLSAGSPLLIPAIQAEDTTVGSTLAGATVLTVTNGANFQIGMFIKIDSETQPEIREITGISGNQLTMPALAFAHASGRTIFHNGTKVWTKWTIPLNATNNVPTNLRDVYFDMYFDAKSRF